MESFQLDAMLSAEVHQDDDFTVVKMTGSRYTGVGVAKRNPRDKTNPQIGFDVATARALRELADQTESGAHW